MVFFCFGGEGGGKKKKRLRREDEVEKEEEKKKRASSLNCQSKASESISSPLVFRFLPVRLDSKVAVYCKRVGLS